MDRVIGWLAKNKVTRDLKREVANHLDMLEIYLELIESCSLPPPQNILLGYVKWSEKPKAIIHILFFE